MSEDLKYRLFNTSIPPPGNAWANIAEQLDKEVQQSLSHKLQEIALVPPADIWNNIQAALDETDEQQAPVVPMRRTWTRIAAAAIAIGVIVLAGLFYFRTSNSGNDQATVTPSTNQPDTRNANSNNNDNSTPGSNTGPNTSPRTQTAANDNNDNRTTGRNGIVRYAVNTSPSIRYADTDDETLLSWGGEDVNVENVIEEPLSSETHTYAARKDYLTIAAPNGQPAKISARFTTAMDCLFNDEPAQSIDIALRNVLWKMRINNWSNKLLAANAFIPAASNFFDIVELEELLKE
jgi:hypothetical protein